MGDAGPMAAHLKHKIEPMRDLNDLEIRTLLDLYFRHKCNPHSLKQDVALRGVSLDYLLDIFKCVDLIVEEQRDFFIGMCEKLRINLATFKRDYVKILDNLFAKEHKWSRMLTAVAFTYTLGNFCRAKGSEDLYEILPELLHQYLNQQPFASEIQRQGGLVGFHEFCQEYLGKSAHVYQINGSSMTKFLSSSTNFLFRMVIGSN